jgi:ectoine hydroxylase-related dioxygenase (phytanoyl-CoA dioxygenase family)
VIDVGALERNGFVLTKPLFSAPEIALLIDKLEKPQNASQEPRRGGIRDVLDNIRELRNIADHPAVRTLAEQVLGSSSFVVRTTLFDKTGAANWKVPWHQDVTIAVSERRETPDYGPWSIKAGILHVQPPSEVLERMLTIRIHLDPCPATNGALRVMPGTHRLGRLNQNLVAEHIDENRALTCEAAAGEALVMRPLLLHTSSPSKHPAHRRVMHFDFATGELDNGLTWRMRQK